MSLQHRAARSSLHKGETVMRGRSESRAFAIRRPIEESRGGWALFGRLLVWSTRNNRKTA
jgi:hypothetical protein